ncbi:MAG: AGE family epimerase/isomerase [Flavobacterium sp.]|nr:AGE family epimerase/isomerase [Flavobacterium sp.]
MPDIKLQSFENQLNHELENILSYWLTKTFDFKNEGYIGQIDFSEKQNFKAVKGSVLNARILWTFSAAYQIFPNDRVLGGAKRAFDFIHKYCYSKNSGVYWSVTSEGKPFDSKNQIYALAFTIYGATEYYLISKDERALDMAKDIFGLIQKHSYDKINGGYFEAFTADWKQIEDLRLSDKDANEKKTMNTHLHIVEAYTNLYKVWPNEDLKLAIIKLLKVIETHFINHMSGHLKLFFDEEWNEKPDVISYGHDIEAAWLLLQCAEVTNEKDLIERYQKYAILMADATFEGIDTNDGGLWYEYLPSEKMLITEKHWWPQSELLIGLFNAWELTNDKKYLDAVYKNWEFIGNHILDKKNGEWIWGINSDNTPIKKDKVGFWKCPYHNSRACIEILKRIKKIENEKAY